jgi:hypothetical protein
MMKVCRFYLFFSKYGLQEGCCENGKEFACSVVFGELFLLPNQLLDSEE